jgi:hypothetical protein
MLATVFPLVMHKAFGQRAALVAIGLSLATIVALALTLELSNAQVAIPVMTVLGPLMILQYSYSRHRQGAERTMWQYHVAER